ncbi:Utp10p [Malassezia vespertilionis]|uniref:U3 small nucleolar RNA-associated protein 10 n=1 Tax=Malassezia vespertilionis TaxID=2020962 RepID=A0A2N1J8I0_9BASI|nr:Utp10p [Malassezia vespertilionis]
MSSSLAVQLAGLRSHNATRLSSSGSLTARDSYLFTPRVAAEQDHETVHALGVTGWEQLLDQDPVLADWQYGDLLFGDRSIKMDRTTMTKAQNQELDRAARELLYLLGPVLLSRNAAKCLEWLIRRFRIQEYVPKALLRAFLPYHATSQFARILQLLPLDAMPEFHFLVPVKKANTPLPTSVLVHALGNTDVLRFVSDTRVPLRDVPRRLAVRFWAATLIQFCLQHAAKSAKPRRKGGDVQAVLAILLPDAMRFVEKPEDTEAAIGALMVLCSIGTAFPLSCAGVRGVLDGIATLMRPELSAELTRAVVACCFALCASPEHVPDPLAEQERQRLVSGSTLQALLQLPELSAQVLRALQDRDVACFLAQLLAGLVEAAPHPPALALLRTLLDDPALPEALAQRTCERLITMHADEVWHARIELLASVRQRRASVLDAALAIVRAEDEQRAWSALRAVLECEATGTAHACDAQDALWLGVQSADETQKLLALRALFAAVTRGEIRAQDTLVRDAILTALADGALPVVQVLYEHAAVLLAAVAPLALLDAIAARLHAESLSAKEYKQHVRFCTGPLAEANAALGASIWRRILWPFLLPVGSAKLVAIAADAVPRLDTLPVLASALASAPAPGDDRIAFLSFVVRAYVAMVRDEPEAQQLVHAQFLLDELDRAPVARSGVLALLTLAELLSTKDALAPSVWIPTAYRATILVYDHQLLAGDVKEVVLGDALSAQLLTQVLDKLSRRSVRLLGVQLYSAVLEQVPLEDSASLFIAVQQRASANAQLLLHLYRALHAPGAGTAAGQILAPALFARLGAHAIAFLAGVYASTSSAEPPHPATTLDEVTRALTQPYVSLPDVPLRLLALRHATHLLHAAAARCVAWDLQTLFPTLVLTLQDATPVLRDAGAALLRAWHAMHQAAPLPAAVYGYDTVYGTASAALQYVDAPTFMEYVARLAADAEAFVNDAAALAAAHTAMLAGTKKDAVLFRSKIVCYLLSHAVSWDALDARLALLGAVQHVHAAEKMSTVLPLLEALKTEGHADAPGAYLDLLFGVYDASSVAYVGDAAWRLLLDALRADAHKSGMQHAALHALRTGFFAALPPAKRQQVFLALAETIADPRTAADPDATKLLRTLPVSDAVLVAVLRALLSALDEPEEHQGKRVRGDEEGMRRAAVTLVTVLESTQGRTVGMGAALVAALFDTVQTAMRLHSSVLFNAEYLLQLAMQTLCDLFDHVTSLPHDVAKAVRADTIVAAIKVSTNTQTINHAILLLTRFARLDAELVLHNIMPIFTFVGLSILQRDDRFTLSVVEQTLRSIMPAFINSVRPQVVNAGDAQLALWCETRSLLRIFSDAASHIPRHRRLVFFRLLVEVLGADDFLAPVAMLLAARAEHRVCKSYANAANLLQLPLGVLKTERLAARIDALNQIWAEVVRLYSGAAHCFLEAEPKREYSEEHMSPSRQALTLLALLRHALPPDADAKALESVAPGLLQFAWYSLLVQPADEGGQQALDAVRHAVICLLPLPHFLLLVRALLCAQRTAPKLHGAIPSAIPDATLHAMGLDLLQTRQMRGAGTEAMAALNEALLQLWETQHNDTIGSRALAALHANIAASGAAEQPSLQALISPLLLHASSTNVLAVLAVLVAHLGVRALAQLGALVAAASAATDTQHSATHVAAGLTLFTALFRALPQFMHGHVRRAVRALSDATMQAMLRAKSHLTIRAAHRHLQDAIVKRMPAATLLDAVQQTWREWAADAQHQPSLVSLLHILQQGVKEMDKAAVHAQYKPLFRFLLHALDLGGAPAERAVHVYVALALKLSETQFRPLFLRTYDWAAVDLLEDDAPDEGALRARQLVFFQVVNALLEQLRGMFVAYYGVLLDLAQESLGSSGAGTPLWHAVLRSLQLATEFDEGTFWNSARASRLMTPLLDQVPLISRDDQHALQAVERAVRGLADAVPDDANLRAVNAALLKHAAAPSVDVRMHAMDIAAALWSVHGLNLLAFVPETVAALTELLEDIDPRCTAAALRLRTEIEKALGEPLDSYLDALGVRGLFPYLRRVHPRTFQKVTQYKQLAYARVAVDATLLTQKLFFSAPEDMGVHLAGFFRLVRGLRSVHATPIMVFDNLTMRLPLKFREQQRRVERRALASHRLHVETVRLDRVRALQCATAQFECCTRDAQQRVHKVLSALRAEHAVPSAEAHQVVLAQQFHALHRAYTLGLPADTSAQYTPSSSQLHVSAVEGCVHDALLRCSVLDDGRLLVYGDALQALDAPPDPKLAPCTGTAEWLYARSAELHATYTRGARTMRASLYDECIALCKLLHVPYFIVGDGAAGGDALHEAEAFASALVQQGFADMVASEDSDVLLYNVPLLRGLAGTASAAEMVDPRTMRSALFPGDTEVMQQEKMLQFALLCGTDFNETVPGIGIVGAHKHIGTFASVERLLLEKGNAFAPPNGVSFAAYMEQLLAAANVFRNPPDVALLAERAGLTQGTPYTPALRPLWSNFLQVCPSVHTPYATYDERKAFAYLSENGVPCERLGTV